MAQNKRSCTFFPPAEMIARIETVARDDRRSRATMLTILVGEALEARARKTGVVLTHAQRAATLSDHPRKNLLGDNAT